MQNFLVFGAAVLVCESLQSSVTLWLHSASHEPNLVHFEHGLKKILTTVIKNAFKLTIAWVVVEATVLQMSFFNLDWTSFVAKHELLEGQEASIPTITFSVRYKL